MKHTRLTLFLFCLVWAPANLALPADFSVTTPNNQFNFQINSVNGNPTVTLQRGRTYTFLVSTSVSHPFAIGASVFGPTPPGVTGNVTTSGTITYAVPTNAPNCVYYCGVRGAQLTGNIVMVDPPAPPTITIVGLKVDTNLTVTSTLAATNGLIIVPEFNTNLASGNCFALTV